MNKSYKITFLDKKRYKSQRGVIVFFSVLYIVFIIMTINNLLNNKPIYFTSILAIIIGLITLPSMMYKYNKKDLSFFIIDNNSVYYRTFLGRKIKEIFWMDVHEAGISRFSFYGDIIQTIYVSKKPLTTKDKYKFMKYGSELTDDILLIKYTEDAYNAIKEFYGGKIIINNDEN